jgi:hypothetical protein
MQSKNIPKNIQGEEQIPNQKQQVKEKDTLKKECQARCLWLTPVILAIPALRSQP